jgi:hypothetical protein
MLVPATDDQTADRRLYAEIGRWVADRVPRRLLAMGGVWRDPKDVGIYLCRP